MPNIRATVEVHLNTVGAKNAIYDAIKAATGEVFEHSILPEAKANSPVGTEFLRPGAIHNRDSLRTKVFGTRNGPGAKIFSTSGHGGFLEVGTKNMSAEPYIWPAFQSNTGTLITRIKEKIAEVRVEGTDQAAASLGRITTEEE